jgi:hypothetical protein
MARHRHHYDRTAREPQRAIRVVTILILLLGAAGVLYALFRPEERRERTVRGLEVGDTATEVVRRLGEPRACPVGALAHLHGHFPPGWSAAAQAAAVERLRGQTAERWVFPLGDRAADPCRNSRRATEVGLGRDRRVLWFISLVGRHPLVLPDTFAPGALVNDTL